MGQDKDYMALLANLDDARHLVLSALADWEMEHGKEWEAKAWMWLRDHKKWPSKRKDTYLHSKYDAKRRTVYGWNFVVHRTKDGMSDWTMEGFIKAHLKGPANIPKLALFPRESVAATNFNHRESQALQSIIQNVVRWLKIMENHGVDDFDPQYRN